MGRSACCFPRPRWKERKSWRLLFCPVSSSRRDRRVFEDLLTWTGPRTGTGLESAPGDPSSAAGRSTWGTIGLLFACNAAALGCWPGGFAGPELAFGPEPEPEPELACELGLGLGLGPGLAPELGFATGPGSAGTLAGSAVSG